jgi:SAM-dependent methyltransferase
MEAVTRWSFDAGVAQNFVEYARRHIPAYDRVIDLSVRAAAAFCRPGDKIAEIGCATGYTLQRLEAAGFRNLVGVDASDAMLQACVSRHSRLVHSESFPRQEAPFRLVLANWTLHFVPPESREAYLADVRAGLGAGGRLLLSEKTAQSEFNERLYHDFKRGCGVGEQEIRDKKRRLAGILEPLPPAWYLETLGRLGFAVEVLWAEHGFVTFLASL